MWVLVLCAGLVGLQAFALGYATSTTTWTSLFTMFKYLGYINFRQHFQLQGKSQPKQEGYSLAGTIRLVNLHCIHCQ
jgi:hypothetical protein